MIAFIDDHRVAYGIEPICRVLPIAPSTYHDHLAKRRDPARLSARAQRDAALAIEVRRVFAENFHVYGVRKVWRQLQRESFGAARCTVARLMREMGLKGVIRGKPIRTTVSDKAAPCPLDKVNRQFRAPAPNMLWLSDFTYVSTWAGFVYVAFVIDAYARRIVGWRVSRTSHACFVLDALEQALHERRPVQGGRLIHHSDRGVQGRLKWSSQHGWRSPATGPAPVLRRGQGTRPDGISSCFLAASFGSAAIIFPSRPALCAGRRAERRSRMAGRLSARPGLALPGRSLTGASTAAGSRAPGSTALCSNVAGER
jgi:hypothetical protein